MNKMIWNQKKKWFKDTSEDRFSDKSDVDEQNDLRSKENCVEDTPEDKIQ